MHRNPPRPYKNYFDKDKPTKNPGTLLKNSSTDFITLTGFLRRDYGFGFPTLQTKTRTKEVKQTPIEMEGGGEEKEILYLDLSCEETSKKIEFEISSKRSPTSDKIEIEIKTSIVSLNKKNLKWKSLDLNQWLEQKGVLDLLSYRSLVANAYETRRFFTRFASSLQGLCQYKDLREKLS